MGFEGINPNNYNNFSVDTFGIGSSYSGSSRVKRSSEATDNLGSFSNVEGDVAEISLEATQGFLGLGNDSAGATTRAERVKSLKSLIDKGEYFNQVDSFSVAGDPGLIEAILG
jgi:anti-sigma28 factor (negative regulator of flagellin synthesis)